MEYTIFVLNQFVVAFSRNSCLTIPWLLCDVAKFVGVFGRHGFHHRSRCILQVELLLSKLLFDSRPDLLLSEQIKVLVRLFARLADQLLL